MTVKQTGPAEFDFNFSDLSFSSFCFYEAVKSNSSFV